MAKFINDTVRPYNNAEKSYSGTYFYTADSLDIRFDIEGFLSESNVNGITSDNVFTGKRYIYNDSVYSEYPSLPTINVPSGVGLTDGDIIERQSNGEWKAVWSSLGLTSGEYPENPYTTRGTLVYNKETENILVFNGFEWKEIQPASSLRVLTTGYTGENISTLNVFGHTGSKNLVFSSEGSDGTASIEVNSPFSSKYFFGPSAPNTSTIPLNFGDRWYNSELGSELVWIPNLPSSFEFDSSATFAGGGTFGTSNVSFIGQDGKSYVLPQGEFNTFIEGNYDLSLYDSLTGAWVMIPIAGGGGTGSLSSIEVDGTPYSDVSSLVFNSGTNTTLESSLDGSSLTITFGVNISEVVGATGATGATGAPGAPGNDGAPGATGATGIVGTISANGNSVTDAQFLSFEDGGIITVSSLTSDSGITVTYSASLVGATGIYVNGSTIGLSANIGDLNDVSSASVIIGTIQSSNPVQSGSYEGEFILTQNGRLWVWDGLTWNNITDVASYINTYFYDEETELYYLFFGFSGGLLTYDLVSTSLSGLFYDTSNQTYIIKSFKLEDISDVTASSPTDGYFLKYNSSTGKWEPGAPPTSSGGTTGIDVSVAGTTHEDQEVLAFTGQNGSNGIPLTQVARSEFQGSTGSLISIELTGAAHSSFSDNRFVSNTSSQGNAKKVLTINEDGTIGWEYIRNYDVVDPNKFNFSVSTFGFDSSGTDYFSTHTIIVGDPGTTFIASDTYSLSATYNGDDSDKLFKITTSATNLNQYYNSAPDTYLTGLYPNGISEYNGTWTIKYPLTLTGYNGSSSTLGDVGRTQLVTQITATGGFEGGTETVSTKTVTFKFDNYVYGGYTSTNLVTSNNTLDIGPNTLSAWLNTNPSTVYRGTYFTNTASIDQDLTPNQLDAEENNYSFILWPERLGWQTPRLAQGGGCLDSIFPTAGDASVVQSAFHALGITLENQFGFEERYNIYQFPNPGQNYSGLRITLTGSNPC